VIKIGSKKLRLTLSFKANLTVIANTLNVKNIWSCCVRNLKTNYEKMETLQAECLPSLPADTSTRVACRPLDIILLSIPRR